MTPDEAALVATTLYRLAGLDIQGSRRVSVDSTVERLRLASGLPDVASYLARAELDPEVRQELLDAVSVGETHWLRNPPQMHALVDSVLPALAGRGRPIRIWSAGCATGEEVYSVAMLALEAGIRDVEVLGTDICLTSLKLAREGVYQERMIAMVDEVRRGRWLQPVSEGHWRVNDHLRKVVRFELQNLASDPIPYAPGTIDLVLCRNVTIYLAREVTVALMGRIREAIANDGTLLLGHSETLWQVSDSFFVDRVGDAFLYRPVVTAPPAPPADVPKPRTVPQAPRRRPDPPEPAIEQRPATAGEVRAALAAGAYGRAERLAASRAEAVPLDPAAHYLHGLALVHLGRHRDAVPVLRKATYVDPQAGFAHFLLATTLERLGDRAAARAAYGAAASSLGRRAADADAPELDGRSPAELAELCRTLASAP